MGDSVAYVQPSAAARRSVSGVVTRSADDRWRRAGNAVAGGEVHAVERHARRRGGEPAGDEERPACVVHHGGERGDELGPVGRRETLLADDDRPGAAGHRGADDLDERAVGLGPVGEHEQPMIERVHRSGRPSHVVDGSA